LSGFAGGEEARVHGDRHRNPSVRRGRGFVAVRELEPPRVGLRVVREVEANFERGEGASDAEAQDVPGAWVDVEGGRERERAPRRELRPYRAFALRVEAREIPDAEPLSGGSGRGGRGVSGARGEGGFVWLKVARGEGRAHRCVRPLRRESAQLRAARVHRQRRAKGEVAPVVEHARVEGVC
jgi:hypothetical protein